MGKRRDTSVTLGSWQAKPDRRLTLYWWPAIAIVLVVALLWLVCWPRNQREALRAGLVLPEPSVAYVVVNTDAQSLYLKVDIFARPTWLGFGRSIKYGPDEDDSTIEQHLPPLSFLSGGEPQEIGVANLQPPLQLPNLAEREVSLPEPVPPFAVPSFELHLPPGLRQAAFTAELSRAVLPAEEGRLRAWVELDEYGHIGHILAEESDPGAQQALRVLRRGSGTNSASGWVELIWRKQ